MIFHCDNFAVTSGIRKSSIRGNAMRRLRAIAMLTAIHDIRIEIRWIPTKSNELADLLSRGKLEEIANKWPNLQELLLKSYHATLPKAGIAKYLYPDQQLDTCGGLGSQNPQSV